MHELFQQECIHLIDQSTARIQHCVSQLNHEQLWWQPGAGQNSIGMILRHVTGNLQQWAVCGITQTHDHRDRHAEFHSQERPPADQLIQTLLYVTSEARATIVSLQPDVLTAPRTIQGFEVSVLGSLMHTIPHLIGHTHQIVTLTRLQLGEDYLFEWNPDAPRDKVPL